MRSRDGSRGSVPVLVAWCAMAALALAWAAPRVDRPGLYYDEAFLAEQAREFVEPGRVADHAGSVRSVTLAGRPFPLRNAVHLGSLKSQLLIPGFAVFGATPRVLRLTTLAWSLLALLCVMLWAQRLLGTPTALLGGVLVALDPAWLFLSLHEWGPFTTNLLCRGAGFWLVTLGWQERRPAALGAGALLLGLGVYSRADFALILAAAALALALSRPALVREALGPRRAALAGAALALAVGAAPMLLSARDLLLTTTHGALQTRGDLPEKLRVLWSVLDGSHFLRLMQAGGRFDRMFALEAPSGGLGLALAVCAPLALLAWLRGRPRPEGGAAARSFLLWTTLALAPAMLALPGAVRAHHMLNLLPFVHLLVASVVVDVWRGAGTRRAGVRAGVRSGLALAMAALLAANGMLIARTSSFIERTGGRGWWSDALDRFARELDAPSTVVVSLDWGFHETVLFHTREARALQPIWRIPAALRSQGAWLHDGDASHVYLLHEPAYDLFGYGPRLLRALRVLGDEAVRIERHTDRAGEVAFVSVRIAAPHRLHFDGAFRVVLR